MGGLRPLRRNPETAGELFAIAADTLMRSKMAKGDKAERERLKKFAREVYEDAIKRFPHAHPPLVLHDWRYPAVVTIDELARLLALPTYDEVHERADDFIWETAHQSWDEDEDGDTDSDAFMERMQEVESDEVFKPWHSGVEAAATRAFQEHGMALEAMKPAKGAPKDARPWQYKISPLSDDGRSKTTSWARPAEMMVDTINGVGPFYFSSVKDFVDSGPWTTKSAVLSHLHWMRRYPEVYGARPYRSTYDEAWP